MSLCIIHKWQGCKCVKCGKQLNVKRTAVKKKYPASLTNQLAAKAVNCNHHLETMRKHL